MVYMKECRDRQSLKRRRGMHPSCQVLEPLVPAVDVLFNIALQQRISKS